MAKYKSQQNTSVQGQSGRKLSLFTMVCLIASLLLVVGAVSWGAVAKYVHQQQNDALVVADVFYFTSDYLTEKGARYNLNPTADGTASVQFELRNFDGENVSGMDIGYEVEVSGGAAVSLSNQTKTLNAGSADTDTVTVSGMIAGNSYTVTVTTTSGYQKTLSAIFVVNGLEEHVYMNVQDYNEYILLTVWTENISGNLSVSVPSGVDLIPDQTDRDITEIFGSQIPMEAYESRVFRFFKGSKYKSGWPTVMFEGTVLDENTPLS